MLGRRPYYLVGYGADDHRIRKIQQSSTKPNRKPLVLAGKVVSSEYSPIAHSDGDVVYHAIANALFLAIGERDIGYHFPENEDTYKNTSSIDFVERAMLLTKNAGYSVNNVTVMITALRPRIGPHVEEMRDNIAKILRIDKQSVGVGATTGEGLSDAGRGKGINAIANVSLTRRK